MFTSVLIGVDGRQGGRDAIALARQLAAPAATLTLGHVCAPILGRGAVEALPGQRAEARKLLARERGRAAVDARLAVRDPFPVGPGLHDLAERQEADLLVVGSTRHALVGRVLFGDDCRAALNGAPCAIAIAPRGYALGQLSNVVDLAMKDDQAATVSGVISLSSLVSSSVTLMPSLNFTPASTSATSSWPLNRRQRSCADSSSL